jgi:drug/metabolite transporter (DMT)-like permease
MVAPAMTLAPSLPIKHATAWGVLCGSGAAICWALGFVSARHGVLVGLSPLVIALHRFVWAGFAFLPLVAKEGFGDLAGVGWGRGITLTILGALPFSILSYTGFLLVPLGHGGLIQPSVAAVAGLLLSRLVLHEALPTRRIVGAGAILVGLAVIGAEALRTMGTSGVLGDLIFVTTGCSFAIFGMLLRQWQIPATRAVAVTSVVSLAGLAMLPFLFDNMRAAGLYQNLLQVVLQGIFAGPGATFLFARAVTLLGAGRAVLFTALVPAITLLIGYLALGEVPSVSQLIGLVIVVIGFRLTQRN